MAYFRTGKTDDVTNTAGPTSSHGSTMVQERLKILRLAHFSYKCERHWQNN